MTNLPASGQKTRMARTPPKAEFTTSRAGLHFHIALVFVPMLLISLPLVIGLAAYNWFKPEAHEEYRTWSKRLLALAVFDTFTIALVAIVSPNLVTAPAAFIQLLFAQQSFIGLGWLDFLPLPIFACVWGYAAFRKHPAPRLWGTLLGILIVSLLAVPLGVQVLLESLTGKSESAHDVYALTAQVLVLSALGFAWHRSQKKETEWGAKHALRSGRTYVLALIYLLGVLGRLSPILFVVEQLFSTGGESPVEFLVEDLSAETDWVSGALLVITVGIIGPIAEELCFRGVLLPAIGKWATPTTAIALTSIAFASLHAFYGFRVLGIVVIGAVLGWARWRSRDLRAPILLHMTINTAAVAALLLGE